MKVGKPSYNVFINHIIVLKLIITWYNTNKKECLLTVDHSKRPSNSKKQLESMNNIYILYIDWFIYVLKNIS